MHRILLVLNLVVFLFVINVIPMSKLTEDKRWKIDRKSVGEGQGGVVRVE